MSSSRAEQIEKDIQVLEGFRKPEALGVINLWRICTIHVLNPTIASVSSQSLAEACYGGGSTIQIFGVPRHTPCIKVGFQYFRTEDVVRSSQLRGQHELLNDIQL